jgi:solute carrier family 25 S-adenosylmethionine transporter 26
MLRSMLRSPMLVTAQTAGGPRPSREARKGMADERGRVKLDGCDELWVGEDGGVGVSRAETHERGGTRETRTRSNSPMATRRLLLLQVLVALASARVVVDGPRASLVAEKSESFALDSREKLLAGGSARFGAQLIMYPADALRTLAQTRTGAKTLSELGMNTLVSGCATTSAFAFAVGGLQFSIFGYLRPLCPAVVASAAASLGSCIAGVPQEVIKQRLVTGIYPNFWNAVTTIAKTEGPLGFYSGWAPTVSRNLPFIVICFCSFDAFQQRALRDRPAGASLTNAENYLYGVSSALIGGLCTQPIDVIKTRLMTQAAVPGAIPYNGVVDCVRTMLRTEGAGAFLAGIRPRMAYMGPLWALQFGLNGAVTDAIKKSKAAAVEQR